MLYIIRTETRSLRSYDWYYYSTQTSQKYILFNAFLESDLPWKQMRRNCKTDYQHHVTDNTKHICSFFIIVNMWKTYSFDFFNITKIHLIITCRKLYKQNRSFYIKTRWCDWWRTTAKLRIKYITTYIQHIYRLKTVHFTEFVY